MTEEAILHRLKQLNENLHDSQDHAQIVYLDKRIARFHKMLEKIRQ